MATSPQLERAWIKHRILGSWQNFDTGERITFEKAGVVEYFYAVKMKGDSEWIFANRGYNDILGSYRFVGNYELAEQMENIQDDAGKLSPYASHGVSAQDGKSVRQFYFKNNGDTFCYAATDSKNKALCFERLE